MHADTFPEITTQPASQTVQEGDTVMFSVAATGDNLSYQWRHVTTNISGVTTNPLVLPNITFDQAGSYSVSVSNSAGTAVSEKAELTVVSREVWQWGDDEFDKATPPPGLGVVVAGACGGIHSLALKADGTVAAWGLNGFFGFTDVPPGLTNVVSVAAGFYHSLALKTDGTVVGWGGTEVGQLAGIDMWSNMVAVAAGANYCVGLKVDGTVELGGVPGAPGSGMPAISSELRNVTAVAAAHGYCLTLQGDGTLLAWGSQTNLPQGLSNVVAVACGDAHQVALKADGTVVAWGNNTLGQTNVPVGLSNVVAIACGQNYSLALLRDGTPVSWGDNSLGQTNVPAYAHPAVAIGAGCAANHSLAVPAHGSPFITTRLAHQIWSPLSPPERVYFRVDAAGEWPLHFQWLHNGVELTDETNSVLQVSDIINHQGDYSVVVSNALGVATIPPAKLLVTDPLSPVQISLGNELEWKTGGDSAWFSQSIESYDGMSAEQSGVITNSQESWIETTVTGPTPLTFWWKVSSEPDYDFLEFHINGELQPGRISGETSWQQQTHPIPVGAHTLRWRYIKDRLDSAGQDAGWLDQVSVAKQASLLFTGVPGESYTVFTSSDSSLPLNEWTELGPATEVSPGQFEFTDQLSTEEVQRFYRVRSP